MMQELVGEGIRWIGFAALRLVSLGRYRGGTHDDRLIEGTVGLGLMAIVGYATYALSTR